MYQTLMNRLREALAGHVREKYGEELTIVLDRPPKIAMGEAASPVCFELAKRLKRPPRQIAQEIANGLGKVEGIARVEVAGGGYLNAYFDRGAFWTSAQEENREKEKRQRRDAENAEEHRERQETGRGKVPGKVIVEHTSINPNKAAHIGHVRNAALGDTMVRILRHAGNRVQIQNYIDNTGVQVADVVIAFLHMEQRTPIGVKMMAQEPRFDYYCWDLYARVTSFFAEDKARAEKLRGETLRAIEEGKGEDAEVAQVVADAIVGCHLRTMARLGIAYELLARESEILHLHFWDAAFEMLKKSGAIQLATSGKMAGCWVMPWKEEVKEVKEKITEEEEENSQDKIIVRSNGTVTYVGKDIAYQLWKFGLLGKDFHYRKWPAPPEGQTVWATTSGPNDPEAPHFGEPASSVYNVIDARQAYLQKVVAAGLRALGHEKEAENSIHLSYEIVALTPRCAAEMGYELTPEEAKKPYVEVSGRKGFGVKAEDLLDKLEAATLEEVQQRHAEMKPEEQKSTAHAIAVGALRFFLLKFTRNAIIAFDFKDALSFEGETGPYCQYAVVRIRGIRRKGKEAGATDVAVTEESASQRLAGAEGNSLWELLVAAGSLDYAVDAAIATQEPAFLAKYAFQLAQAFNNFYHKRHILSEADEQKRAFLLRLTELVEAQLVRALSLLGITAPEKM
ncbi:MAG TPA: arginine--tRNA ligase [Candidatus Polarisedimenticolia bacterium]|nr:arginine--tRNA ligase [Candidatus Polarisedimenticolia bacterium]